jgi:UDP-GlcNAc:undecaprenyl-phosphate GlcNAc-1-phosphate transferase
MSLIIAYLGIITVLIIALNAKFFGELLGLMDDPNAEGHKEHSIPTPLVGALMIGALAIFIIANQYFFEASTRLIAISVATIVVGVLGLIDDRLNLGWAVRLVAICVICLMLVIAVPELRLNELIWSFGVSTELGPYGGIFFSVLCLMTLVISFNMMDGFNGGVIGFSIVLFVIIAITADNPHRQAICLFLASALGVMLVYNMKGEFFLGDGGAYALGLLVGSVAILSYNADQSQSITKIYADSILTWLALPTIDCLRVVLKRKFSEANPFYASRDHLHHIMIQATGPKMTLFIYITTVSFYATLTLFSGELTSLVFLLEITTFALFMLLAQNKFKDQKGKV